MPHNIDSWETISCSLTADISILDSPFLSDVEYDDEGTGVSLSFNEYAEVECFATVEGDHIEITELSVYGESSGTCYRDNIIPFFAETKGRFEAAMIWEGETIEHLLVIDGEVNDNEYTPGELIKRINELTAMLEL